MFTSVCVCVCMYVCVCVCVCVCVRARVGLVSGVCVASVLVPYFLMPLYSSILALAHTEFLHDIMSRFLLFIMCLLLSGLSALFSSHKLTTVMCVCM